MGMREGIRAGEVSAFARQAEGQLPVEDLLDILRLILRVEPLDELLQKIVDTISAGFAVKRVSLGVVDESTGLFCPRALHGYPPERALSIKRHAYTLERMKTDLRPEFKIGRSAYYVRAEDQQVNYDDEPDYIMNPELVDTIRGSASDWHELDYIDFVMTDRLGNWIGWIEIDEPTERMVPSKAVVDKIQILSDLAAIAIENANTYDEAVNALTDSQSYLDLIVHDIGNLVSPMMYYLESAGFEETPEQRRKKQVKEATAIGDSIRSLVGNVRKFSEVRASADSTPQQRTNLGPVLRECVSQLRRAFPDREVAVTIECPEDANPVLADDLISELFMNVLSNAVKYTPGHKAEIDITVVDGYSAVTVAISDHGRGIPDSRKPYVFERFANRPDGFEGTGLGLSIVSLLVKRYNGLIAVKDRVAGDCSRGTCFEVSFPKVTGIASDGMYTRTGPPLGRNA